MPVDLIETRVLSLRFYSSISLVSREGDSDFISRGLIRAIPVAFRLKKGGNRDLAIYLYTLLGLGIPN